MVVMIYLTFESNVCVSLLRVGRLKGLLPQILQLP